MKFLNAIKSNHTKIRENRANLVAKTARLEQESLISELERSLMKVESEIDNLTDLSPKDANDLRAVADDFDAHKWVVDLQSLKVSKANIEFKLKIAKETFNEWFVESEK